MINRAVLILKYKEPFITWINEADPNNNLPPINIEEANDDRTVYLIDDQGADNLEHWLSENHKNLLETELMDWSTDESLWPIERDMELFNEWIEAECHAVVVDFGTEPLLDDEL